MKRILWIGLLVCCWTTSSPAFTSCNDAVGDFTPSGFGYLDITGVVVSNDLTTLTFQIHLAANPLTVDWAKYLVGLDTVPGGNTTGPDGWGKPISMSEGGMDYFIGSWMNFGTGAELRTWTGSAWTLVSGSGISVATGPSSVVLSLPMGTLGLNVGDTFRFDVYTTSDGNAVLDALSTSDPRSWNNNPFDTGSQARSYTLVPEPNLLGLLILGGGLWWQARRGRRRTGM
ncbi:MAG: PEP-CTERM sorting domain-containing protein [Verrucomicrobiota bacterium]|nr:PEP-CTERM sorting domain-containing protein [Limisphaera sp.]MDW8381289.1 PEP-CTERM sorting domain-containing protein [Verrucomicrobiota bacterium]